MHPVARLIADRRAAGSLPGRREDGHRLALAIEGGSSRGTYSSGMVMALEELGLLPAFDAVYGSSAGALNGAWLLCGRAKAGMRSWWDPDVMRRVINPLHPLRGRPVVDTGYLVHSIYGRLQPMDFPAILAGPVTFHPLATDADTGESTDLAPFIRDERTLQKALRATTCIPILAGEPIHLGGRRFLDAGLAEPLPFHTALAQGATHVLVLRTRRADERPLPTPRAQELAVPRYLRRHAPGVLDPWRTLYARDLADEKFLDGDPGNLLSIRPAPAAPDVGSLERDPALLRHAVNLGRAAVLTTF
ncbi:patatin-like phospholipase family protein [Amycolatopsis nigrescens]|uniref:patatin-like phospholipase family protein n=1 Tax=Amycolatopsis nigrescens TaxID=381445 RepID=UPI000382B8FC|nr:patatin family protein [Amycolatopsis nigrescens]